MKKLFVPDLNLWFSWHNERATLPAEVSGMTLTEICRYLEVPLWKPARPWKRSTGRISVEEIRTEDERTVRYHDTVKGLEYTARWSIGPDGDLWQTEYPVKSGDDLALFEALTAEETLVPDSEPFARLLEHCCTGDLLALELPLSPFSRLLLEMTGFNEGIFILMEEEERIGSLVADAEKKYASETATLIEALTPVLATVHTLSQDNSAPEGFPLYAYCPDNLDASFISPGWFETYMLKGYQTSASLLGTAGLQLMVHAGGPIGNLLELIRDAGISALTGVCAAPQGDTSFPEARKIAGPDMLLWGGLAQDLLMPQTPEDDFRKALGQVREEADEHCIIGIADHVPAEASWERIKEAAAFY
jgi:hypothetical protein